MRYFFRVRRSLPAVLFLGLLASGFTTPAHSASRGSGLFQILATDAGLAILRDTAAGREIAWRVLGREIGDATGVAELKLRLEATDPTTFRLREQLETRIGKLEEELQARLAKAVSPSGAERDRVLEELATKYLTIDTSRPSVWFESLPNEGAGGKSSSNYAAVRGEFSRTVAPSSAGTTFDAAVPIEKGSLAARLSASVKMDHKLIELETRYFREKHLLQPDLAADEVRKILRTKNITLKQVIAYLVDQRQALAKELDQLAHVEGRHDAFLKRTLIKAAQKISLSESALGNLAEKGPELDLIEYVNGKDYLDIRGYTAVVPGEMGELRVAMRVSGVVERGLMVADMGRYFPAGPVGDAARAELRILAQTHSELVNKELDLIIDNGLDWGEVKAYSGVFSRTHHFYDKVIDQAQRTLQIKSIMEADPAIAAALKAMNTSIRLRIYFLNGVTEEVAQELEALGLRVFGVRYLTPLAFLGSQTDLLCA